MRYWTPEDKDTIRLGIVQLAQDECKKRTLNQWQLTLIFKILAFGTPVEYRPEAKEWRVRE